MLNGIVKIFKMFRYIFGDSKNRLNNVDKLPIIETLPFEVEHGEMLRTIMKDCTTLIPEETDHWIEKDFDYFTGVSKYGNILDVPEYQHEYDGGLFWHSYHGYVCLNDRHDKRFSDITRYDDPVSVTLVIDNENPDFYLQRYKDCIFISNRKSTCIRFKNGKDVREEYVEHDNRISNKLFTDIT